MDLQLHDSVALVTAASRGIGRATAERLAAEGATVIAAARSTGREEGIGEGRIIPVPVDLTVPGAAGALVDEVHASYGRLDVLVANTPGPPVKPVLELDWADWEAAHGMLLRPVVELFTHAGRLMTAAGTGSMVLVSSNWVREPLPGSVLSAAYRSAESGLVKTLAGEIASSGVRVNQVLVGGTATERMERLVAHQAATRGISVEQAVANIVAGIPQGRLAEVGEVADVIAFLASPVPGSTTGATFVVDGGALRGAH